MTIPEESKGDYSFNENNQIATDKKRFYKREAQNQSKLNVGGVENNKGNQSE